jgi:cell wall-associated NlpC family hydrolase
VASTRKPIRAQLVIAAGASLALLLGTPVLSAHADPVYPSAGQVNGAKAAVGDKVAQVAAVQAQLMASNARLDEVQTAAEVASEKYNLARILLQQRTDAAKGAGERAASAQQAAGIASDKLGQLAATTYMQGGNLGQLEAFLSSSGPQEVLDRAAGIQLITDIRGRIMQDANASSVVAGVLRRAAAQAQAQQLAAAQEAESARAQAQAQVDAAAAETASIQAQQGVMIAQLATLRSTSVALEKQRQDGLKAQAQARAAAAAQARVAAQAAAQARAADQAAQADAQRQAASAARARRNRKPAVNQPVTSGNQSTSQPAPVTVSQTPVRSSGGASAAIAFARAQIGEPYQWGAAGPSSWDCSGLTMMAWAQAGVPLSHFTGFQWGETSRVPLSQLQPGDLVFFGADGPSSHHVGLYVGNNTMINAPHEGASVRYDNIYSFGSDLLPYGGRP